MKELSIALREEAVRQAEGCKHKPNCFCDKYNPIKESGTKCIYLYEPEREPSECQLCCADLRELARELEPQDNAGKLSCIRCDMNVVFCTFSPTFTIPFLRSVLKRLGLLDEFIDWHYEQILSVSMAMLTGTGKQLQSTGVRHWICYPASFDILTSEDPEEGMPAAVMSMMKGRK